MNPTLIPSKPAYQWGAEATTRPRSSHAEWLRPSREPFKAGRFLVRFLIAFCFGVLATLAWQSYSEAARGMIANLSPRLSWLALSPAPVGVATPATPSSGQEELKTISSGLAEVRQRIEELAAQLAAVQEQMTRDISNKLEAVEQNIFDKVSAPSPRPAAAQPRKAAQER
jgi:hypothetical protein